MTKALREMQGKYVGNRPIKVRKSNVEERMMSDQHKPLTFDYALGVSDKAVRRQFAKGGALHSKPKFASGASKKEKKKQLPW